GAFWVCQRLPARTFRALALPLLIGAFVLQGLLDGLALLARADLLAEPQLGPLVADTRWLRFGGLSIQPSELVKFALVVWAADLLARTGALAARWRELSRPLFPVAGLLLLMVGYQDLGTMLSMLVLFVGILWAAGVRLRVFAGMALVVLGGVG